MACSASWASHLTSCASGWAQSGSTSPSGRASWAPSALALILLSALLWRERLVTTTARMQSANAQACCTRVSHAAAWAPGTVLRFLCRKGEDDKKGPFFLFIFVDDEIAVARGRGGGVAFWKATSPSWEAESGVAL